MKKIFQNILILVLFVVPVFVQAQTDSLLSNYHIAVFAPLYLDSAFDESGNYRYDKDFPKFLNTGLEFFEGVQLAVDSLQKEGARLEVHVYDTKSAKKTVQQVLNDYEFQNINLIIGYVSPPELRQLAGAALRRNIPFINANFPNDENIRNNKAMVILNATLKTHCEGIYQFLQKNYRTQTIYVIAKDGVLENRLKNYFSDIEKNSRPALLKLKFVTLDKKFDTRNLKPYVEGNTHTIFVAASLDEAFAKEFCFQLSPLAKTKYTTVIGMPTWDNINDFSMPLYNGLEIMYTTPFYMNTSDSLVAYVQQYFKTNLYMRASDLIFRGFETMYHFANLLKEHGDSVINNISEKKYYLFNHFDIEPVYFNKMGTEPDYYENKKLYFIKKVDGNISVTN